MSVADTAAPPRRAGDRAERIPPTLVIAGELGRLAQRAGARWGLLFGLYVFVSAKGYASAYPTQAARTKFAASLGDNAGLAALVGKPHALDTVAGFTAWRTVGVLSTLGAIWALRTGTRLLRGEEDAGRWELFLAGQTTRRRAATQAVAGLGLGWLALTLVTFVVGAIAGRSVTPHFTAADAAFLAVSITAAAALFLAVAAVASQVAATRRQALIVSGAVLGVALVLRIAADTGSDLDWLRWLTPLGWVEELRPLTGPQPLLLLPLAGLTAILAATAIRLAAGRDLGGSVLTTRDTARPRTRLLNHPAGLAARLARPSALGWMAASAGYGLLLGLVAKTAVKAVGRSRASHEVLSRLGAPSFDAKAFLGIEFVLVTAVVCVVAAGQVAAAREEEAEGRLDNLLARPLARHDWLLGRLAVAAAVVAACGVTAGVAAWIGAVAEGTAFSFGSGVAAGANTLPAAIFVLGFATLVYALAPRLAAIAAYGLVAWSFLVQLIGSLINLNHLALDTSVLHHVAAVPATGADGAGIAGLLGFGILGAVIGIAVFARRDLVAA